MSKLELINELSKDIENFTKKQEKHIKNIKIYVKDEKYIIAKNIYQNPISYTGTNYKGRKCLIKNVGLFNGRAVFQPLIENLKTRECTIYHNAYYEIDYFSEAE